MSNIREMPGEGMKNDNAYQFNGEVIIFSLIDCLSFFLSVSWSPGIPEW
jgi:hypothetical protein